MGPLPWRRKLGYRGPEVELPAGAYSDDTQLRLATSRAIRADGTFDVEAFSRVELPVWQIYSLGAGRGSLDAARRLSSGVPWHELVRGDKSGRYVEGGGNGGAMRIQPFVWAGLRENRLATAVIENVACTHGHPKAFVGSLFHAACLVESLRHGGADGPKIALQLNFVNDGLNVARAVLGDDWLGAWNRSVGADFAAAWSEAIREIAAIIQDPSIRKPASNSYHDLLERHGLLEEKERGSATKTAAAAYAALYCVPEKQPERLIAKVVTTLGSDTDSIATMVGAMLGAELGKFNALDVQDRDYILDETLRVASGRPSVPYADSSPRMALATINGDRIQIAGLGTGVAIGERYERPDEVYRWYKLDVGQSVLVKESHPRVRRLAEAQGSHEEPSLFSPPLPTTVVNAEQPQKASPRTGEFGDAASYARKLADEGFDAAQIGRTVLSLARRDAGEGYAAVFAFEIVRLRKERSGARPEGPAAGDKAPKNVSLPAETKPPESVRAKPRPQLQLQLTAALAEGTHITGIIENYGREDAKGVRILFGDRADAVLQFERLKVRERHEIDFSIPANSLTAATPAFAYFEFGSEHFRQEGVFEPAHGRPDILLLKGLGSVAPVATA